MPVSVPVNEAGFSFVGVPLRKAVHLAPADPQLFSGPLPVPCVFIQFPDHLVLFHFPHVSFHFLHIRVLLF